MDKFKEWITQWILYIVGGFDGNVARAAQVLTTDVFDINNSMFQMAHSVSNIVKPVALVIITILFLIEFLSITAKLDILKWEYGLRVLFKFVLAKVAIDAAFPLMDAIYTTCSEWASKTVQANGTLGATVSTALTPILRDITWSQALGLASTMILPFLVVWAVGLMIIVIAYARVFEIMIYIAVSPLPCALVLVENSRITKKFFLAFSGVCLQGLFIILSIKLYQSICETTLLGVIQSTTDVGAIAFNMLLGALVLLMAVVKSGSWAKSILDAM